MPDECVDQLGLGVEDQITVRINTCSEGSEFNSEGCIQPCRIHSNDNTVPPPAAMAAKHRAEKWTIKMMWSVGRPSRGSSRKWLLFFFPFFPSLYPYSPTPGGNLPVMTNWVPGGHSVFSLKCLIKEPNSIWDAANGRAGKPRHHHVSTGHPSHTSLSPISDSQTNITQLILLFIGGEKRVI